MCEYNIYICVCRCIQNCKNWTSLLVTELLASCAYIIVLCYYAIIVSVWSSKCASTYSPTRKASFKRQWTVNQFLGLILWITLKASYHHILYLQPMILHIIFQCVILSYYILLFMVFELFAGCLTPTAKVERYVVSCLCKYIS